MDSFDLVVIGAGPGGYVAALRAAQLGMSVACVEKEKMLGGTCLRVGCIPSKALLESSEHFETARDGLKEHGVKVAGVTLDLPAMMKRKDRVVRTLTTGIDGLFRKNKVARVEGTARIAGPGSVVVTTAKGEETIAGKHVLIATGSRPAGLPGVAIDGDRIGTSTEALSFSDVPARLVVIGAGYIGLELGSVWRRLGSKVTVLEYLDRILPGMDAELAAEAMKVLGKQGLSFTLSARVTGARLDGAEVVVEIEGKDPVRADRVLVAVGRSPSTEGLGLDAVSIATDGRGRIEVDEHFQTSAPGFFAIGDVIRGPMLAHKAEEEAIACVEWLATGYGHVNYDAIPGVCYTDPEAAAVGKTEEELVAAGTPFRKGRFPFLANGRARTLGRTEGFVKVLAHEKTDRILGIHILGPRAGEMIAEAVAALEFGATAEDLARTCHAHPTLPEALKEAALAVAGRALHV
ncbi:MAG: dihydrolipoyl dehydrogenase [Planctomycetes bacterium]|nr:dihydrolipoyl dehydrogenase [Planctomycetota bacterium]